MSAIRRPTPAHFDRAVRAMALTVAAVLTVASMAVGVGLPPSRAEGAALPTAERAAAADRA